LSTVTKIMEWVSIMALLLVVSRRPAASYQIPLELVVCWGALVGVLALFFIKREMETHYDVDNRIQPREASHCKRCGCLKLTSQNTQKIDRIRMPCKRSFARLTLLD